MFEVGFQEMALVFVIALVVLGPEKLPKLARTLGQWTGRARAYVRQLSSELEREVAAHETREQLQQIRKDLQDSVRIEPLIPPENPPVKTEAGK